MRTHFMPITRFNVKLAQRFVCSLSRKREITSDLPVYGFSRMASSSIRVGEGETGMTFYY
jgi:hypothetical protein